MNLHYSKEGPSIQTEVQVIIIFFQLEQSDKIINQLRIIPGYKCLLEFIEAVHNRRCDSLPTGLYWPRNARHSPHRRRWSHDRSQAQTRSGAPQWAVRHCSPHCAEVNYHRSHTVFELFRPASISHYLRQVSSSLYGLR